MSLQQEIDKIIVEFKYDITKSCDECLMHEDKIYDWLEQKLRYIAEKTWEMVNATMEKLEDTNSFEDYRSGHNDCIDEYEIKWQEWSK